MNRIRTALLAALALIATGLAPSVVASAAATPAWITVSPTTSSAKPGGSVRLVASGPGLIGGVTWTTDSGALTSLGATATLRPDSVGVTHVTAVVAGHPESTATAQVVVVPPGQQYPVPATPTTSHPRLWVTQADLPRLRAWATGTNPVYAQGLKQVIAQKLDLYQHQFFPGGKPNPTWPDPGDSQGYTGELSEDTAVILAFASLIDPSPGNRIVYAQDARNLIMPGLTQAARGLAEDQPFRDASFPIYNRASLSGLQWPLVVDWIYDAKDGQGRSILTTADKAIARQAFMVWSAKSLDASTTGGDSPPEVGVVNSTELLPNGQPYRMAANNYYLAHARNLTMMSLALDPADDPAVNPTQPVGQLGNSLRSYLTDATGAWLYQIYGMFGDASKVAQQYQVSGNPTGHGFGLASGGLPPEGMLYGESIGTLAGMALALKTAGVADLRVSGPQANLVTCGFWGRYLDGMISSLTPQAKVAASEPWEGALYQYAAYGDQLRNWVEPDGMGSYALIGQLPTGQQPAAAAKIQWVLRDVMPGGAAGLTHRVTSPWATLDSILYFLSLNPTVPAAVDPRPTLPKVFYDAGQSRLVAHSAWGADDTIFDFHSGWRSINHQQGDAGSFGLYRHGEWLTKQMTNYDNNLVGFTPYYLNTLALQNRAPIGTPDLSWDEAGIWKLGGQWLWGANAGDPVTRYSTGPGWIYATTDLTNLYNRPNLWDASQSATDITAARRSILWLNRDFVITYDRATSKSAGLFKGYNLSLANAPTIAGRNATEVMPDGQRLYVKFLLPANANLSARRADTDLNPVADLEPMTYVLTSQDATKPKDATFLTVLQGADAGRAATAATALASIAGDGFDGVQIGTTAAFFRRTADPANGQVTATLTEPTSVTATVVAGLHPGATYSVASTVTGTNRSITIRLGGSAQADAAGVLRL